MAVLSGQKFCTSSWLITKIKNLFVSLISTIDCILQLLNTDVHYRTCSIYWSGNVDLKLIWVLQLEVVPKDCGRFNRNVGLYQPNYTTSRPDRPLALDVRFSGCCWLVLKSFWIWRFSTFRRTKASWFPGSSAPRREEYANKIFWSNILCRSWSNKLAFRRLVLTPSSGSIQMIKIQRTPKRRIWLSCRIFSTFVDRERLWC